MVGFEEFYSKVLKPENVRTVLINKALMSPRVTHAQRLEKKDWNHGTFSPLIVILKLMLVTATGAQQNQD